MIQNLIVFIATKTRHTRSYTPLLHLIWQIAFHSVLSGVIYDSTQAIANAQIIPDDSLGRHRSSVREDLVGNRIEGGLIRGENLFHSFLEFNVGEGQWVTFDNPRQVNNIFTRVTGNHPSEILGILGVDGPANLFLLNPNGIVLGPDAVLNLEGSFLATTSDQLIFGNGESFGVATSQSRPLLTIRVPIGLQLSAPQEGDITILGNLGRIPPIRSLTFIGDDIQLQASLSADSTIQLLGRNIFLSGLEGSLIFINAADVALQASDNVGIENPVTVDSSNQTFQIEADRSINIDQSLQIGGDIEVVSGGDVRIAPGVSITSFGNDVSIQAKGDVYIEGDSNFASQSIVTQPEVGAEVLDSGNITIEARSLTIANGGLIDTSPLGDGNSGDIIIRLDRDLSLFNTSTDSMPSLITTSISSSNQGTAGDIRIVARSLLLADGAQIQAILFRSTETLPGAVGEAGNIRINADEAIRITGTSLREGVSSGLLTSSELGTRGEAGAIRITTRELQVVDGAVIDSLTTNSEAGGNIVITAHNLTLSEGGQIISTARRSGSAGQIVLNVTNEINISGRDPTFKDRLQVFGSNIVNNQSAQSGLFSNTVSSGSGGDIELNTNALILNNGAIISAESTGTGRAGDLRLGTQTTVANDSLIRTSAEASTGGRIHLSADQIRLQGDSDIQTNVNSGEGGAGDIRLDADAILAFDDSDILAFADDGRGGNIRLNTPAFFGEDFNPESLNADPTTLDANDRVDINATGAVSGTVTLPDLSFIQNNLIELPQDPINTDTLLASSCVIRTANGSTFLVTGRGGLPERPGTVPIAEYSTDGIRTLTIGSNASETSSAEFDYPVEEPQGLYQLPDGRFILSQECP